MFHVLEQSVNITFNWNSTLKKLEFKTLNRMLRKRSLIYLQCLTAYVYISTNNNWSQKYQWNYVKNRIFKMKYTLYWYYSQIDINFAGLIKISWISSNRRRKIMLIILLIELWAGFSIWHWLPHTTNWCFTGKAEHFFLSHRCLPMQIDKRH